MNSNPLEPDAVDKLAEDFVSRYRRGERVDLQEYVMQFPELANEVLSLVQALLFIEKAGKDGSDKHRLLIDTPIRQ